MSDRAGPSVDELAEYCRTQAGLLSGHAETIGAETDALLDEIDEDIATLRTCLADHGRDAGATTVSPSTAGPDDIGDDLAALDALESDLEEKQALAEAKQARRAAVQDLAAAYIELAEDLESAADDWRDALDRVVRFEHDRDAPAYFDDRRTLLEAAADSDDSPAG